MIKTEQAVRAVKVLGLTQVQIRDPKTIKSFKGLQGIANQLLEISDVFEQEGRTTEEVAHMEKLRSFAQASHQNGQALPEITQSCEAVIKVVLDDIVAYDGQFPQHSIIGC